jgi:hypothetical protein
MPVEHQAAVDAPFQHTVEHEVERAQIGKRVSLDRGRPTVLELPGYDRFADLLGQQRVNARVITEHGDVEAIALVAGARMRDLMQRNDDGRWRIHASPANVTDALTASRGM